MAVHMVRKLLLEIRNRLYDCVLGEPLAKMSFVVTWKIECVFGALADLAEEGGLLPSLVLSPVFLMSGWWGSEKSPQVHEDTPCV